MVHQATERASAPIGQASAENASPGHNHVSKEQLRSIIERVERLTEEKKTISDDIGDIYVEAKGNGYDVKALRTIVRLRKMDANEREQAETILETYMQAMGML